MRPATLTAEHIELSPPSDADAPAIADAICDPDIAYWIDLIPWPYTVTDALYFVHELAEAGWESGQHPTWVLRRRGSTEVLGAIGLTQRLPAVYEVGYWLTPSARGQGLATEAVRAACSYAFETLGAHRIEWQAAVGNVASRAVAERAGIRIEGTARNRLMLAGAPCDSWFGSLLPSDEGPVVPERRVPYEPVELAGSRLSLHSPMAAPEQWVVDAYRDADIRQWNPSEVEDTESARRWIRNRADWSDGTHASWIITFLGTREPVGAVSLHKINHDNLSASIGYWTVSAARGRGVATSAVDLATHWAFDTLGLQRVELIHAVANAASCSVARANDYLLEGTVRRGEKYGDGHWYDEHIHGRLSARD